MKFHKDMDPIFLPSTQDIPKFLEATKNENIEPSWIRIPNSIFPAPSSGANNLRKFWKCLLPPGIFITTDY
jgi:hypothetical protein